MLKPPYRFIVTSAPGLESLLADELTELGLQPELERSGGVVVHGDWATASVVLTRSRIAARLLWSLRRFTARNKTMLYSQVRRVDWPRVFEPHLSFSVDAHGSMRGTDLAISYTVLRIKDAVCDEFRKQGQERPDVERQNPDLRLSAFFLNGRCELSVDLSGAPLHRRGYREAGAEAPLRENRAAALLRFAGYDGSRPLVDPFCGSGTIPIEAALMATRTAPGLLRPSKEYALIKMQPAARAFLESERGQAEAQRLQEAPAPIRGFDHSRDALAVARKNAALAGVKSLVSFERVDARSVEAPDSWIVTNPPYGERLDTPEEASKLLEEFVHEVKHRSVGSCLALVLPRGDLEKAVRLRADRRVAVESGSLGLRFLVYQIQAGRFSS